MSFFHEIKKQSLAVRQVMFGLCVITTISMVGMIWYHSFENKLFTLMDHQSPTEQSTYLAQNNSSPSTLFASIYQMFGNMNAATTELFHIFSNNQEINSVNTENTDNTVINNNDSSGGGAYKLPISGDK